MSESLARSRHIVGGDVAYMPDEGRDLASEQVIEALDREDWERIFHALSQFQHNTEFQKTHDKVRVILERSDRT